MPRYECQDDSIHRQVYTNTHQGRFSVLKALYLDLNITGRLTARVWNPEVKLRRRWGGTREHH
ncbi:hypothetical protein I79_012440 [Cricetulus griseus]|uniref:Uncharacterized protein n=1 Tax=Cricetulus griseus TaxID=10029 RepID=G3HNU6_CRIGR|nr:hypothetical protein I79_012440 [Cricetulus griseus]